MDLRIDDFLLMMTAFQIDGSIHCVEKSPHATSRPVRAFPQGRILLTMNQISNASILQTNAAHVWMFRTENCWDQAAFSFGHASGSRGDS